MERNQASPTEVSRAADHERTWRLLRRTMNALRGYFAQLLRVSEEDKAGIYAQVFRNSDFADLNYWLEVVFSIGIATLGLIINSPAVVIGAMLISPLMGPIIASGLAIALGDFYLGFKAFINTVLSTLGSVLLAALITWALPFRSPTPEILARVEPTMLDLGVAVLSGLAGAIVVCLELGLDVGLVRVDHRDLCVVKGGVELVELSRLELELVEGERYLVRVEAAGLETALEQALRFVGRENVLDRRPRARALRFPCDQTAPLSSAVTP